MSADIPALVQGYRRRLGTLRASSVEQRCALIQRLLDATMARKEQIRATVREELGLCDTDIDAQLMMIKVEAEFVMRQLKGWVKPTPVQGSLMTLGKKSYVQYEPKGVVLVLGTWNAPYAIAMVPAFGAIAAGNAVIIKPSELAPASSALIAEIVAAAQVEEAMAVVEGGAEVAQSLLAQPVNHIVYIGGHAVGRIVMKAAADHFATVTLEMGGKNPVIVDRSADIEDAARKIAWGRLSNAGQICIGPEYVLAHADVAESLIDALQQAMSRMYNADGRGFEHSEEYPRIINERHTQRILGLIADAKDKGAQIRFGGEGDPAQRYVAPTILTGTTEDMQISGEEVFGPVLVVKSYEDIAEATDYIQAHPKPLAAYVYARDRQVIDHVLAHTTSGSVVVNHNVIQSGTNPNLPFGGVNDSGMGRLGGYSSFLECSNARAVVEEGPALMDPELMFPPYQDKYKKMVTDMLEKTINVPNAVLNGIHRMIRLRTVFWPHR